MKINKEVSFLLVLFIFSRIIAHFFGVKMVGLEWLAQMIDVELLKFKLKESLLYDHYQPPFVNLFAGIALKIFPDKYKVLFGVLHTIGTLIVIYQLNYVLVFLKISRNIRIVFGILLVLSPALLYFEYWLFYHHVVLFLFSSSVFFLCLFAEKKHFGYLFLFYLLLAAVSYFRTSFFWAWFLIVFIGFFLLTKNKIVHFRAASLPFLLIVMLNFKNLALFGFWGSSSLNGVSQWLLTDFIPYEKKVKAFEEGKVSKVFLSGPWSGSMEHYKNVLSPADTIFPANFKNIGVLTNPNANQMMNFHHYYYLKVLNMIGHDSKIILASNQDAILRCMLWGAYVYFQPSSDYGVGENISKIYWWNRTYNTIVLGQIKPEEIDGVPVPKTENGKYSVFEMVKSFDLTRIGFIVIAFYVAFLFFIFIKIFNAPRIISQFDEKYIIYAFLSFNLIYTAFIYITFGTYENNRLRHDAFVFEFIIFASIVNYIYQRYFRKKQRKTIIVGD